MNFNFFIAIIFVGAFSTILLIFLLIIFGKLMILQLRIWMLAKKGWHLVEHIGDDKVRRYIFARPKDKKFDFNQGFYHFIPETVTKRHSFFLKYVNTDLLGKDDSGKVNVAENEELMKLIGFVKKMNYDREFTSLAWGIPMITYYADNPDPVLFSDRKKEYGAGVIRDMYLRLLLTTEYSWIRKMITIGIIALCAIGLILIIYYFLYRGQVTAVESCQLALNKSVSSLIDFTNVTLQRSLAVQNSTVII